MGKCALEGATAATADYCQDGKLLTCPLGFVKTKTAPDQKTIGDCEMCPAGEVCATSTAADCPTGYFCSEYTADGKEFASPPGTKTTGSKNAIPAAFTTCQSGEYCPPATTTAKTCDVRYAASLSNLADAAGCRPHQPGKYYD